MISTKSLDIATCNRSFFIFMQRNTTWIILPMLIYFQIALFLYKKSNLHVGISQWLQSRRMSLWGSRIETFFRQVCQRFGLYYPNNVFQNISLSYFSSSNTRYTWHKIHNSKVYLVKYWSMNFDPVKCLKESSPVWRIRRKTTLIHFNQSAIEKWIKIIFRISVTWSKLHSIISLDQTSYHL